MKNITYWKWGLPVLALLLFAFVAEFPFKRHSLSIDYPDKVYTNEVIHFRFRVGTGIRQIHVLADQQLLGRVHPSEDYAHFSYFFRNPGVQPLRFVGLDENLDTLNWQSTQIEVQSRPKLDVNESDMVLIEVQPMQEVQSKFLAQLQPQAIQLARQYRVPASVILGMAALESGYGTSLLARKTHNLFGMKKWREFHSNAYQLRGQADESSDKSVKVLYVRNDGSVQYDESSRKDNWYWRFESREVCLRFFVEQLLLNGGSWRRDYRSVVQNYRQNLANGMTKREASNRFVYDLGHKGYCMLGGAEYQRRVGRVMNDWNLYELD
jgi:Mannosyl-glycoprotein endo-beta-N-acetylglucosaminidase